MVAARLNKVVRKLSAAPRINVFFILAYFILILLLHDPVVRLSLVLETTISTYTYHRLIKVICLLILILLTVVIFRSRDKLITPVKWPLLYAVASLAFIILHLTIMFDSIVEIIHAFEFTFLAFLIFPLTGQAGRSVLFTLPFMMVDEWYQYALLYPTLNDYLDLNDVMMDTYGCGLGISLMVLAGLKTNYALPFWKRSEVLVLLVSVVLVFALTKLCIIAPYAGDKCSHTLLVINERTGVEPLFRIHPKSHAVYHVMKPLEGLLAIMAIHLFYLGLDKTRPDTRAQNPKA